MLKVCSWNVNSIKRRSKQILNLIREKDLDVLMIQETRSDVGEDLIEDLKVEGYRYLESPHRKGRAGVALIFRDSFKYDKVDILKEFSEAGRWISIDLHMDSKSLLIGSAYVHQGASYVNKRSQSSVKDREFDPTVYRMKLKFLREIANVMKKFKQGFIIGGDFNVVATDLDSWHALANISKKNTVSFTSEERDNIIEMMRWGKDHSYELSKSAVNYTWYDYRGSHMNWTRGMKVDYVFSSLDLECESYERLLVYRQEGVTSDHVPIMYLYLTN